MDNASEDLFMPWLSRINTQSTLQKPLKGRSAIIKELDYFR